MEGVYFSRNSAFMVISLQRQDAIYSYFNVQQHDRMQLWFYPWFIGRNKRILEVGLIFLLSSSFIGGVFGGCSRFMAWSQQYHRNTVIGSLSYISTIVSNISTICNTYGLHYLPQWSTASRQFVLQSLLGEELEDLGRCLYRLTIIPHLNGNTTTWYLRKLYTFDVDFGRFIWPSGLPYIKYGLIQQFSV